MREDAQESDEALASPLACRSRVTFRDSPKNMKSLPEGYHVKGDTHQSSTDTHIANNLRSWPQLERFSMWRLDYVVSGGLVAEQHVRIECRIRELTPFRFFSFIFVRIQRKITIKSFPCFPCGYFLTDQWKILLHIVNELKLPMICN